MRGALKRIVRRAFGEQTLGTIDYYRWPDYRRAWGGPFNGQARRQELVHALIASIKPTAIVETGTYRGTTTELFADTGLPVVTIEGQARNYGYATTRFKRTKNVHVILGDSRAVLRDVLSPMGELPKTGVPFLYLDAHWNEDLPLAEELEIAFSLRPEALVMVDDFAVEDDPDYAYDDYGPDKALTAAYISRAVRQHGLAVFYPSTPGRYETGARRGCVVLTKDRVGGSELDHEPLLRRARYEAKEN